MRVGGSCQHCPWLVGDAEEMCGMNEGEKDSKVPFCVCKDFTRLRPDLLGADQTHRSRALTVLDSDELIHNGSCRRI